MSKSKLSAKDRIKQAGPPTRTVPIWLGADLDLLDQYAALQAELENAPERTKTLAGTGTKSQIQARLDDLREQLEEYRFEFRLRGMDAKRYQAIVAEHPPRQAEDGTVDPRDAPGWNRDTFPAALVRAATVAPELDGEDWLRLLGDDDTEGLLTEPQLSELAVTALSLSRHSIDVPFSSAASPLPSNSARE